MTFNENKCPLSYSFAEVFSVECGIMFMEYPFGHFGTVALAFSPPMFLHTSITLTSGAGGKTVHIQKPAQELYAFIP